MLRLLVRWKNGRVPLLLSLGFVCNTVAAEDGLRQPALMRKAVRSARLLAIDTP